MIITAWIILIVFGVVGLLGLRKLIFDRCNKMETLIFFISVILAALSAGVIWGGLFHGLM
jgi:hypothetical protein